jgi:hypothetical protein
MLSHLHLVKVKVTSAFLKRNTLNIIDCKVWYLQAITWSLKHDYTFAILYLHIYVIYLAISLMAYVGV